MPLINHLVVCGFPEHLEWSHLALSFVFSLARNENKQKGDYSFATDVWNHSRSKCWCLDLLNQYGTDLEGCLYTPEQNPQTILKLFILGIKKENECLQKRFRESCSFPNVGHVGDRYVFDHRKEPVWQSHGMQPARDASQRKANDVLRMLTLSQRAARKKYKRDKGINNSRCGRENTKFEEWKQPRLYHIVCKQRYVLGMITLTLWKMPF